MKLQCFEMTTNKIDKRTDVFFRSPIGIARYPRTEVADTRFDEKGVFSVGLILATDEIAEVEAKMREIYRTAFPDDRREVKLPFKEDEGQRYLLAKSAFQPKVCDAERRPITTVEHGQTIRVVGRLRAYKTPLMGGIALYLHAVDVMNAHAAAPPSLHAPSMGEPFPF